MRIAYLTSAYYPHVGGIDVHVKSVAEACANRGDQVTILTHLNDAVLPREELINGVHVLRFPLLSRSPNYALSPALFRYLRRHAADFDIVHAHSYHTIVGQAAIGVGLPKVFSPHYHGTGHTSFRALLHRVYRPLGARVFRAADAVICNSAPERELVVKDFPMVSGKLSIVHPGTDRRPTAAVSNQAEPPVPVVLTVGRLERYKNLDLVIKAVSALPVKATLVIVGEGPDRERLEELTRAAGPELSIRFAGRVPDEELDGLLAQATVVTSASEHEAFGLVLLEGLSAGARVVASDIPSHREVGGLAGDDAPIEFVDIQDVSRYTGLLETALRKGRIPGGGRRVRSWSDVADETRSLYVQVIGARTDGHPVLRGERV
jgi:1,2-diacylglycerol 3-alpha-glucosyltransferase